MYMIGLMPMPPDFRYRDVFERGKPRHDCDDPFLFRHPRMPAGKRAKIFAPFDALRGFDFAIMCKNELYTDKMLLSQEEQEELDRRFSILRSLTFNSRIARANRVQISVTYYEACKDVNHEAYGAQGQYRTVTGICWNVDAEVTKTILLGVARAPRTQESHAQCTEMDGMRIPMGDILKIEAPGKLFEAGGEDQSAD